MPDVSNYNLSGVPITLPSLNNNSIVGGFFNKPDSSNLFFLGRVTGVDYRNQCIFFENTTPNFGPSSLGNPNIKNKAIPVDIYNVTFPQIGEYIEIIAKPDAIGLSNNKNNKNFIYYYGRVLNTWDNINGNKVLDQTVKGQVPDNQLYKVSQKNINKSIILGGV